MKLKRIPVLTICLLTLAGFPGVVEAGSLEPAGPPAPTMVTLQDIYDLWSGCPGGLPVHKSAQTLCWDQVGVSIACAGTGQDGEYQTGISVSPRFTDNGDGTVTDNLTGLIWLKDASAFAKDTWAVALADAASLADPQFGLSDGSVAGDWRLPNIKEFQTLIDYSEVFPALPLGHPFVGTSPELLDYYWSSTSDESTSVNAWILLVADGHSGGFDKLATAAYSWPVRGGK